MLTRDRTPRYQRDPEFAKELRTLRDALRVPTTMDDEAVISALTGWLWGLGEAGEFQCYWFDEPGCQCQNEE